MQLEPNMKLKGCKLPKLDLTLTDLDFPHDMYPCAGYIKETPYLDFAGYDSSKSISMPQTFLAQDIYLVK